MLENLVINEYRGIQNLQLDNLGKIFGCYIVVRASKAREQI